MAAPFLEEKQNVGSRQLSKFGISFLASKVCQLFDFLVSTTIFACPLNQLKFVITLLFQPGSLLDSHTFFESEKTGRWSKQIL